MAYGGIHNFALLREGHCCPFTWLENSFGNWRISRMKANFRQSYWQFNCRNWTSSFNLFFITVQMKISLVLVIFNRPTWYFHFSLFSKETEANFCSRLDESVNKLPAVEDVCKYYFIIEMYYMKIFIIWISCKQNFWKKLCYQKNI